MLTWFDDEHQGAPADLESWIVDAPEQAHFYCCGPQPMLDAYQRLTSDRDPSIVHLERFSTASGFDNDPAFEVHLARSGRTIKVAPGRTVLDVLLEQGIHAQYGCMQGACGACEVTVLDGVPDHRDSLVPADVRDAQHTMLICCSRARSASLTLDI